jgi:hypothetical protein
LAKEVSTANSCRKKFGKARDRAGIFGHDGPFRVTETGLPASLRQSPRKLKAFPPAVENRHRLRNRRHGGIMRTSSVNDRGVQSFAEIAERFAHRPSAPEMGHRTGPILPKEHSSL